MQINYQTIATFTGRNIYYTVTGSHRFEYKLAQFTQFNKMLNQLAHANLALSSLITG